jgi:hypothetical protein
MKAVIRMGYRSYVVDAKDALTFHEILAKAERYERKYRSDNEGGPLYYIWDQDGEDGDNMEPMTLLPDAVYRMAKLAGKPAKE